MKQSPGKEQVRGDSKLAVVMVKNRRTIWYKYSAKKFGSLIMVINYILLPYGTKSGVNFTLYQVHITVTLV